MKQALIAVLSKSWFIAWWRRTVAGRRACSCAEAGKHSSCGPARLRNVLGVIDLEAFARKVLDRGVCLDRFEGHEACGFIVPDRGAVPSPVRDADVSPCGFFNPSNKGERHDSNQRHP